MQFEKPPPPSLDGLASNNNKAASRTVENWIEAKNIYNSYLHDVLVPVVYDTMYSVYRDAENLTESKKPEDIERTFMDFLVETKVWSLPIIEGETENILKYCPWFGKLLKGVFVANVMVLSSAQLNRQNAPAGKVRLHIPQCQAFVQALYANVAARLFNYPNIFRTVGLTSDQLIEKRNLAYREIQTAIDATVRSLLPIPQVIESSMNFSGNNPVITARPPPTPVPAAPTPVPTPGSRVSSRKVETTMKHHNFEAKPRLTPPAPPIEPSKKSATPAAAASAVSFSHKTQPQRAQRAQRAQSQRDEFHQSAIPAPETKNVKSEKPRTSGISLRSRINSGDVKSVRDQLDMESTNNDDSSTSTSSSSSPSPRTISDSDDESESLKTDERYSSSYDNSHHGHEGSEVSSSLEDIYM